MTIDTVIAGIQVGDVHPVRLMGVINLSLESFYKGSVTEPDNIISQAQQMIEQGADLLDVGARSTWPLAAKITKEEERRRLIKALDLLLDNVNVPISVDTQFADLASDALDMGAHIINDVSGLTTDKKMVEIVSEYGCPVVVMASNSIPGDPLGMNAVMSSLDRIVQKAEESGVEPDKIIIDPAIGKWLPEKSHEYDFETLDQLERLKSFDKSILVAISRKSCIGEIVKKPASERLIGSLAATAISVYKGAHIIRTHDVGETCDAVRVAEAIKGRNIVSEDDGYTVEVLDIANSDDAPRYFAKIGATCTGSQVMKGKSIFKILRINNVTTTEAIIIKQEALARGCDAALPRDAVSHETESVDLILMGTELQIKRLAAKLQHQARDLPIIARLIITTLKRCSDTEYRYR
ncbi:MAG: dihydropteroate synthase [Methanosarcinales archaeon]|nr:dihydropteroate synthase [Methanosarcinales archaeon]